MRGNSTGVGDVPAAVYVPRFLAPVNARFGFLRSGALDG